MKTYGEVEVEVNFHAFLISAMGKGNVKGKGFNAEHIFICYFQWTAYHHNVTVFILPVGRLGFNAIHSKDRL